MRTGTLILAIILILAGVVIFLTNLGYVTPLFGQQLLRLWPLILIIIGIGLFWGGVIPRPLAFSLVIVLVIGLVALGLVMPHPGTQGMIRSDLIVERERHPGLEEGRLTFRFGGGRLFLDTRAEEWFEGDFRGGGRTSPSYSVEGRRLDLRIKEDFVNWPGRNVVHHWRMQLSPDLRWDLNVDCGAVDGEFDLEGLPLNRLNLKLGAGNLTVRLGDNGEAGRMRVEAGAANLKVEVREDTGISIGLTGVLANNNLRDLGWPLEDGRYRSPAYENGASRVDLDIEMAVGNFSVEVLPVER